MSIESDLFYMRVALEEARKASLAEEVPVGAVLTLKGKIIAKNHNRCIELNDPTAHAEILVLRRAGKALKNYRLNDTVMYVTVEPCPMCASAMVHSRVSRLVFGAFEPKSGAVVSRFRLLQEGRLNHKIEVTKGVLEKECAEVLRNFFKERRRMSGRSKLKNSRRSATQI